MFSSILSSLPSALQFESKSPGPGTPKAQAAEQQNQHQLGTKESTTTAAADGDGDAAATPRTRHSGDESAAKKKEKDRKPANETFIVVRPPPAKSNHPLNLQVQLVPPKVNDRDRPSSRRESLDQQSSQIQTPTTPTAMSNAPDDGVSLTRTASNRSDVSMYSGYTSVSSFSSVASSSTGGSRRMIIPLYNLQAHNVMTNVIVDAGTDAKIVKFAKRGMELIGLAVLEPMEVYGRNSSLTTPAVSAPQPPPPQLPRRSVDSGGGAENPETPTSSSYSLSSAGMDNQHPSSMTPAYPKSPGPAPLSPSTPTSASVSASDPSRRQKIFGKLFKRKDGSTPTSDSASASGHGRSISLASTSTPPATPSPTTSSFLKPHIPVPRSRHGLSASSTSHTKRSSTYSDSGENPTAPAPALQPAVLGIQPLLNSPHNPPKGKPHSYAWIVRRWIKGSNAGLLNNVMGMMSISNEEKRRSFQPGTGTGMGDVGGGVVEVQFIWSRGVTKGSGGGGGSKKGKVRRQGTIDEGVGAAERRARRRESTNLSSGAPSTSSLHDKAKSETGHGMDNSPSPSRKVKNRLSTVSIGTNTEEGLSEAEGGRVGYEHGTRRDEDEDEGNESDPEDSETPWTCTLCVRRLFPSTTSVESEPKIKVKVATLSPTPHHPKVVSLLKIPFPLPDIAVDTMEVRKRAVTPQGIARPSGDGVGGAGQLMLTAEEIKDVVSSTGLWLVVREGIGGVGKERRKGDGWRIRA